jgi:glucose/arabinose dehydrogenase
MRRALSVVATAASVAVVGAAAGCGGGSSGGASTDGSSAQADDRPIEVATTEVFRVPADQATALATDRRGRLLVGERLTGRVRAIDPATGDAHSVTTVTGLDGDLPQGGLLDLAVEADGRLVASLTAEDGHLVVDELHPPDGAATRRWTGPLSQPEANGGRLAVLGRNDARVLVGVGDLLNPERAALPDTANGKVMAVDAEGGAAPWAPGFNNPFALGSDGQDTVWIADNAPGNNPERLLRVTEGRVDEVASWDDTRVPAGLAVLDESTVAVCFYATGDLVLVDGDRPGDATGHRVATDCRYGVESPGPDMLAYSTSNEVVLLRLER